MNVKLANSTSESVILLLNSIKDLYTVLPR